MNNLEICCDASIKKYPNGRTFGCAGAVAIGYNKEVLRILPDSTNNRSECIAVLLAIKLAKEIIDNSKVKFDNVTIYSDSKFVIYGLKVWMDKWLLKRDENGVMYNYNNEPVKNQELFLSIINFLVVNKLAITFRHQKGHVKYLNQKSLAIANKVFYESNGYYLDLETLTKISYYNSLIDNNTRVNLNNINYNDFPVMERNNDHTLMCRYTIPEDYKKYIL